MSKSLIFIIMVTMYINVHIDPDRNGHDCKAEVAHAPEGSDS